MKQIKAKVFLQPSTYDTGLYKFGNYLSTDKEDTFLKHNGELTYVSLFIVSDEKIEKGNLVLNTQKNEVFWAVNPMQVEYSNKFKEDYKVIGTSDTGVREDIDMLGSRSTYVFPYAKPSDDFIAWYINPYNIGKPITEVLVEIEEYLDVHSNAWNYVTDGGYVVNATRPIINKDYTLNIRQYDPKLYTREEVTNLLRQQAEEIDDLYRVYTSNNILGWDNIKTFIDKNLKY